MGTKFLLSLLSRIIPLTAAFLFALYSDSHLVKICAYGGSICLLVLAELFAVYRPLGNMEELQKKMIDHYFKEFVESAELVDAAGNHTKIDVRINVMLIRWNWVNRHFFQFYQCGMAGHPDANMHFRVSKGFCGKTFKKKIHEPHFIDFRGMTPDEVGQLCDFSKKELEITANLKAMVCVPLYREVKSFVRGNPQTKFYGVLNVDTIENSGAEFLKTHKIQEQVKALAGYTQLVLN